MQSFITIYSTTIQTKFLHGLLHRGLVVIRAVDLLALGASLATRRHFTMQLHELAKVKLGLLEDFHLPHIHVMHGEDTLAGLLNVLANTVRDPTNKHKTRSNTNSVIL